MEPEAEVVETAQAETVESEATDAAIEEPKAKAKAEKKTKK